MPGADLFPCCCFPAFPCGLLPMNCDARNEVWFGTQGLDWHLRSPTKSVTPRNQRALAPMRTKLILALIGLVAALAVGVAAFWLRPPRGPEPAETAARRGGRAGGAGAASNANRVYSPLLSRRRPRPAKALPPNRRHPKNHPHPRTKPSDWRSFARPFARWPPATPVSPCAPPANSPTRSSVRPPCWRW